MSPWPHRCVGALALAVTVVALVLVGRWPGREAPAVEPPGVHVALAHPTDVAVPVILAWRDYAGRPGVDDAWRARNPFLPQPRRRQEAARELASGSPPVGGGPLPATGPEPASEVAVAQPPAGPSFPRLAETTDRLQVVGVVRGERILQVRVRQPDGTIVDLQPGMATPRWELLGRDAGALVFRHRASGGLYRYALGGGETRLLLAGGGP